MRHKEMKAEFLLSTQGYFNNEPKVCQVVLVTSPERTGTRPTSADNKVDFPAPEAWTKK